QDARAPIIWVPVRALAITLALRAQQTGGDRGWCRPKSRDSERLPMQRETATGGKSDIDVSRVALAAQLHWQPWTRTTRAPMRGAHKTCDPGRSPSDADWGTAI